MAPAACRSRCNSEHRQGAGRGNPTHPAQGWHQAEGKRGTRQGTRQGTRRGQLGRRHSPRKGGGHVPRSPHKAEAGPVRRLGATEGLLCPAVLLPRPGLYEAGRPANPPTLRGFRGRGAQPGRAAERGRRGPEEPSAACTCSTPTPRPPPAPAPLATAALAAAQSACGGTGQANREAGGRAGRAGVGESRPRSVPPF